MNNRIKELAQQTDVWCDQNHHGDKFYDIRWEEKFAELIVKECARVAINADLEDVDGSDSHVLQAASEQIKQHFGVE